MSLSFEQKRIQSLLKQANSLAEVQENITARFRGLLSETQPFVLVLKKDNTPKTNCYSVKISEPGIEYTESIAGTIKRLAYHFESGTLLENNKKLNSEFLKDFFEKLAAVANDISNSQALIFVPDV